MKDRLIFYGYLAALVLFSLTHNEYILCSAIVLAIILSGKKRVYLLKKSLLSFAIFGLGVTLAYALISLLKSQDLTFLASFNLRIFLFFYLAFWVIEEINIFNALPKKLSFALALAFSTILHYKKSFLDFWLGVKSRWPGFRYSYWVKSLKAFSFLFINKSLHDSKEMGYGMRSRGFFDD